MSVLPTAAAATPAPDPAAAAAPPRTALRAAFGRYATGVTIVTCRDAARAPVGLTCNSFASLSLDPPLVLWSLRQASPSAVAFREAGGFAVNVLAESQIELSRRFASSVPDKFAEGAWRDGGAGAAGAPVLIGAAAIFECDTVSVQAAGDHWLFIGQVRQVVDAGLPPLVFHGGHYHLLGEIL